MPMNLMVYTATNPSGHKKSLLLMPMNLMVYTAIFPSIRSSKRLLMPMNLMVYTATSTLVYTADLPQAANCSTY